MAAIYTIPSDRPFLDALAAELLRRVGGEPLALTRTTILLPTRRAVRGLSEAFLRASEGRALLLPRMVPVGDLDAEELAFAAGEDASAIDIPPALPPLRRQLLLTRLVLEYAQRTTGPLAPGQAAPLAQALGRFLDEVQSARGDLAALAALAPAQHAAHWEQVLKFLEIVTDFWPAILADAEALDPAERRNQVLAARIAAWERSPPHDPVIAAGLTGGIAAVADLVAAVARLPAGEIVLPGLDFTSGDVQSIAIDPTHPQFLMGRLLSRLEIAPEEVKPWPGTDDAASPRRRLVHAALAPAWESDRWRGIKNIGADAIAGLRQLDCAGAQEEAETIALLLRHCLETEGKTAAVVTPDRTLARRVASELKRWDIAIDDSAGTPLAKTPPAVFLRLILEAASESLAPLPLLAALKHPLAAGGQAPGALRAQVRRLEAECLRGSRPAPGFAGLRAVLRKDAHDLHALVDLLERAFGPLIAALGAKDLPLAAVIAAHVTCAETLAATHAETGPARLWAEEAGEAAAQFVAELAEASRGFPWRSGADYPALFEALLVGPVVRPRYGRHPRLAIWGLLEARLQQADLMILGGLNEDVWPPRIETDAFLSRPMRKTFGLPSPEERIGVAAHDFAQALGAREVVLTRATRVEGAPTVPSRWLLRLDAVLRAAKLDGKLTAAHEPLAWQGMLDRPSERRPVAQPAPCPPVDARPRELPATQIERLIRDPYAVYARYVLKLRVLDKIDAAPDAADRGNFIHDSLSEFLKAFPAALPENAVARLIEIGDARFAVDLARPELRAFWWPRFVRIAHWFVAMERSRRHEFAARVAEIKGTLTLPAPYAPFRLTATADRIDRRHGGGLAIIDYKTGSIPQKNQWTNGYAQQLPLEAIIAEAGGFPGIEAQPVTLLEYWRLSGADPAGEVKELADDDKSLRAIIDGATPGLAKLIAKYDEPATPYRAVPRAEYAPRYNDFEHLERIKEWSVAEEPIE